MAVAIGNKFSATFGIDPLWMSQNGVFDPTLDVDAPLFIDPFLLSGSAHKEFSSGVLGAYEEHYSEIYALVRASRETGDKAWRSALQRFTLSEAKNMHGTCLGYSRRSTHGRAIGPKKAAQCLLWSREVIDLGVKDPELFSTLPLFEKGIGSDLISDMVACVGLSHIIDFNQRIISQVRGELGIELPLDEFEIRGSVFVLVPNPFDGNKSPVILIADDVLKYLPILEDPRDIARVAEENAELRDQVNKHLAEVFTIQYKNERERLKRLAMRTGDTFQVFLNLLKRTESKPYDVDKDPAGIMDWREVADEALQMGGIEFTNDKDLSNEARINQIIVQIVLQFKKLVEVNRLGRLFFVDNKPRHERFAQLLFLAIALSYCQSNGLDISPEPDAGAGPVDFKISTGSERALVEIKLTTNNKTVQAYKSQLDAYAGAENANYVHYVVIDVGSMGNKMRDLRRLQDSDNRLREFRPLYYVDAKPKASASKLSSPDD